MTGRREGIPGTIRYREVTDSTQADARRLVAAGRAEHGDVCLASFQTAGRGRLAGRVWEGEKNRALMFTLIMEGRLIPPAPPLSLILGLAAARALESFPGLEPAVKWPNDIYLAGRKAAGILCESARGHYLCGLGLNLNQESFSPGLEDKAVSLRQILGGPVEPEPVLDGIRRSLFSLLDRKPEDLLDDLSQRLLWRGEEKTLLLGDPGNQERVTGRVSGLAPDGALVIEKGGEFITLYSAEFLTP